MGTLVLACGCAITSSMFGTHAIVAIVLCDKHAADPEIAKAIHAVVEQLRELGELPTSKVLLHMSPEDIVEP